MDDPKIESKREVEQALAEIRDLSDSIGAESPAEDFEVDLTTDDMTE